MNGEIIGQRKTINMRRSGIEKYSAVDLTLCIRAGKSEKRIFDPSRGGIGMRLKSANKRFTKTITVAIEINAGADEPSTPAKRMPTPKISAKQIFTATPAPATKSVPYFLLRRLFSLYGTGFAQPIIKPAFKTMSKSGKITEPTMSICLSGLSESLPA